MLWKIRNMFQVSAENKPGGKGAPPPPPPQTDRLLLPTETDKPKFQLIPKILNGGLAGMIGVSVVFPIDLVKTRLQTQPVGPNGEVLYKNMFDCFRKTYAAEGYFGMYRGSLVNILLITPEKALKLTANDVFRYYLSDQKGYLPLSYQILAGGAAGLCQIIITTPMELLKIRMQDAGRIISEAKKVGKVIKPVSAAELVKEVLSKHGVFGLYKGIGATALRDIIFNAAYFPVFSAFNNIQWAKKHPTDIAPPFWWTFLSGFLGGTTAAIIVNPFDVIKTRMQTTGGGQYKTLFECFTRTLKNEGPFAFLKGITCRIMVLAPLFGIAQTIYFLGVWERILGYEIVRAI